MPIDIPNSSLTPPFKKEGAFSEEDFFKEMAEAIKNAPDAEVVEKEKNKYQEALEEFVKGGSLKNFHSKTDKLSMPGEIKIPSFEILLKALRGLGFDNEFANRIVEHEKDHWEEEIRCGFDPGIFLQFWKNKNGKVQGRPYVQTDYPDNIDGEFLRNHLEKVFGAPENPSSGDRESLKYFQSADKSAT